MDTKVNYAIVGLFMTILTLALIGATIWLAGVHSTKTYLTYITYISEPVTGLTEKAPVKFNGVDVGFVEEIDLNPENPQQVRLVLRIQSEVPITEGTRSYLVSQGLTGIMVVGLSAQKVHSPPLKKKAGQKYPVILSKPSLFFRIDQAVQEISKSVTQVADNINALFSEQNKEDFSHSLKNLREVTDIFENNAKNIDQTLQSLQKLIDNSAAASDKLPQLMQDFESSLKEAKGAAKNLRTLTQSGSQSLEDLSQQTLPMTQQVMIKLKRTLDNIEQLTAELNRNPSMLVRGKQPTPLGPGER